jgi:hypothetical protein
MGSARAATLLVNAERDAARAAALLVNAERYDARAAALLGNRLKSESINIKTSRLVCTARTVPASTDSHYLEYRYVNRLNTKPFASRHTHDHK